LDQSVILKKISALIYRSPLTLKDFSSSAVSETESRHYSLSALTALKYINSILKKINKQKRVGRAGRVSGADPVSKRD